MLPDNFPLTSMGDSESSGITDSENLLSDSSLKVIETHRDEIRDHFKFVWSEYLKWFSFFCTFNLTAIAVIHTVGTKKGFNPFVVAFLAIDILGTGSSLFMCRYSLRSCRILCDAESTIRRYSIPQHERDKVSPLPIDTLPASFGSWASIINLLVIFIFILVWIYIYRYGVEPPRKI